MTERLTLSGFESHIKLKISNFIFFNISRVGLFKTVNGLISFGKAKVFTTEIFPIKDSFLWFQRLRQFTKSLSFGIRLFSINFCLPLEKIIPYVLAELEVHIISNFSSVECLYISMSLLSKL